LRIQPSDTMQGDDRNTQSAERYRCGVRQQRERSCLKRPEPKTNKNRAADGHRGSKSRGSLKKRTEGKRDQQQLKTAVLRHPHEAVLKQGKPARLMSKLIKKENREDDPADGEET